MNPVELEIEDCSLTLRCKFTWFLFSFADDGTNENCGTSITWPYQHFQPLRNETYNWFRTGTAVRPCPGSPAAQQKLISIRIAAGGANHTSLLKWSIFLRGWTRWQCLTEKGSNGKMQISGRQTSRFLHFIIHHDCIFSLAPPISSEPSNSLQRLNCKTAMQSVTSQYVTC